MSDEILEAYSVRVAGIVGQEIIGPEGTVVGWTLDSALAHRITGLLNGATETERGHLDYLSS